MLKEILASMILILAGVVLISQFTTGFEILRILGIIVAGFGFLIGGLAVRKEITA